jgi:hypothetical protein
MTDPALLQPGPTTTGLLLRGLEVAILALTACIIAVNAIDGGPWDGRLAGSYLHIFGAALAFTGAAFAGAGGVLARGDVLGWAVEVTFGGLFVGAGFLSIPLLTLFLHSAELADSTEGGDSSCRSPRPGGVDDSDVETE